MYIELEKYLFSFKPFHCVIWCHFRYQSPLQDHIVIDTHKLFGRTSAGIAPRHGYIVPRSVP